MWVSKRISKRCEFVVLLQKAYTSPSRVAIRSSFWGSSRTKDKNSVRALRSNNDYAKVEYRLQANARMLARDVRALHVKSFAFDPFESVYIARKENLSDKIFLRLGLNRSKSTEKEISKRALRTSARLASMLFAR